MQQVENSKSKGMLGSKSSAGRVSRIQAHKVLSTSMIYHQQLKPQWVSDTQLNYMSQYDFMTYELDEDRVQLIERPVIGNLLHASDGSSRVQEQSQVGPVVRGEGREAGKKKVTICADNLQGAVESGQQVRNMNMKMDVKEQNHDYEHKHTKQIVAVKYYPLIGHRNVRIVYLYKQQCKQFQRFEKKTQTNPPQTHPLPTSAKIQSNPSLSQLHPQSLLQPQSQPYFYPDQYLYNLVILPSINFNEEYCVRKILVPLDQREIEVYRAKYGGYSARRHEWKKIIAVSDFVYYSDSQFVVFPILYERELKDQGDGLNSRSLNNKNKENDKDKDKKYRPQNHYQTKKKLTIALVYMNLSKPNPKDPLNTISYDLQYTEKANTHPYSITLNKNTSHSLSQGLLNPITSNNQDNNLDNHICEYIDSSGNKNSNNKEYFVNLLNNTKILFTKQMNCYVVVSNGYVFLVRLNLGMRQFELLDRYLVTQCSSHSPTPTPTSSYTITLSKTYLLLQFPQHLHLLSLHLDDHTIHHCQCFPLQAPCYLKPQDTISSISASLNSNKIFISFKDKAMIYQFRINDIGDCVEYVNCVGLEGEVEGVSRVIGSETGRNVAVFVLDQGKNKDKEKDGKDTPNNTLTINKRNSKNSTITSSFSSNLKRGFDILNFFFFKIQLYTELGIPQSSLYIKQIKYKNRNRRVNRLVIPKIYQKMYALTGSQVHTLQTYRISGVFFFDVHPCGFYMAVSYSSTIKIYSLQHNSMTLLYSLSLQNLKKVLYTPDGSNLVLFSSRKLKIIDAYSYQLKQQITEKNNSIIDVCFSGKFNNMYVLYDNGVVMERNFYEDIGGYGGGRDSTQRGDYGRSRNKIYRIFGHGYRKILGIHIDQHNQTLFLHLQDGTLTLKPLNTLTTPQQHHSYPDSQKISQLHINKKNNIIFIGTKAGILRLHNVSINKFDMKSYSEIYVGECEITAIVCSYLENFVYVGNCNGDVTMIRYNPYVQGSLLAKSSKILKSIAPKVAAYYNFDFQLISIAKFQGNTEQTTLQSKLQNLIQKIQQHTSSFRQTLISQYSQKQRLYQVKQAQDSKNLYKQYDSKIKKLKLDLHYQRERYNKMRKQCVEGYEAEIKDLFVQQEELKRVKEIKVRVDRIEKEKLGDGYHNELTKMERTLVRDVETKDIQIKKQVYEIELDMDELGDIGFKSNGNLFCKISDRQILKNLSESLSQQLSSLKSKNLELNKSNSYLQTARTNILSRRIQQQTLQHRITQQLCQLSQITLAQQSKMQTLTQQLKSTQDIIHHIQNKVKNTPNNVISSDKADSDLCSYKIWMKDKVQGEVNRLEEYLGGLELEFQTKSAEIIGLMGGIEANQVRLKDGEEKLRGLRNRLKLLRYQNVIFSNSNINLSKDLENQLFSLPSSPNKNNKMNIANKCELVTKIKQLKDTKKRHHIKKPQSQSLPNVENMIGSPVHDQPQALSPYPAAQPPNPKKIVSMQRLYQKSLYSQSRNQKIHTRKIRNFNKNNAQLLHQYEKLKYENKWLLDKMIEYQREVVAVAQNVGVDRADGTRTTKNGWNKLRNSRKSTQLKNSPSDINIRSSYKQQYDIYNPQRQQNRQQSQQSTRRINKGQLQHQNQVKSYELYRKEQKVGPNYREDYEDSQLDCGNVDFDYCITSEAEDATRAVVGQHVINQSVFRGNNDPNKQIKSKYQNPVNPKLKFNKQLANYIDMKVKLSKRNRNHNNHTSSINSINNKNKGIQSQRTSLHKTQNSMQIKTSAICHCDSTRKSNEVNKNSNKILENDVLQNPQKTNPSKPGFQSPFLKYVQARAAKTKKSLNLIPLMTSTNWNFEGARKQNQDPVRNREGDQNSDPIYPKLSGQDIRKMAVRSASTSRFF